MLGLPQSTEVKRPLPKAQLYRRFDWKPSQRESFDGDVARLDFVNWISPRTLPAIAEGTEIKEIFVIEVTLKKRDFDMKNIMLLAKSIPQSVIYLLRFEDEAMLAVFFTKLFTTSWTHAEGMYLQLRGLNLDVVWENIVREIGNVGTCLWLVESSSEMVGDCQSVQHRKAMSLHDQIIADEQRAKIERQIATLERQMYAAKQPRRKRELFEQIHKLKNYL